MKIELKNAENWTCGKCNETLVLEKTKVKYLDGSFEVELMKCPKCKMVLIDEDLAMGKMMEVERSLEDK